MYLASFHCVVIKKKTLSINKRAEKVFHKATVVLFSVWYLERHSFDHLAHSAMCLWWRGSVWFLNTIGRTDYAEYRKVDKNTPFPLNYDHDVN